ncbi:L,D-transpeptidase, partial [Acetobacter sp.]
PAPAPAPAPVVELDEKQIQAEIDRLRSLFQKDVPGAFTPTITQKDTWRALARQQIIQSGYAIQIPQAVVVADRNPAVQRACVIVARPDTPEWTIIGCTRISTGTIGRKHHYITPVGIFTNTAERLGYRAQGTKNENGIMGNGTKGMRVWDFGWQVAEKGWLPSREQGPIRLEMHATDPVFLERKLGHMASAGCIRIPAALNIYIDKNGLLDLEYERKAATDKRFRALLRPDRTPSSLAGMAVIVVDSASPPNVTTVQAPSPNLVSARIPNSPIH